jgi:peroxiredoxin
VRHLSRIHRRSLLVASAVTLLPLGCASAKLPPSRSSRHLGSALPPFAGTTVNGLEFDSNASRGLVLLVEFFECDRGSRSLTDAAELYTKDRELVIVGVSLDDSIERTRAFVAERSVRFPVLFDPERSVAALVGVTDARTSLAVDRRGILRWVGDATKPGAAQQATEALLDEA